MQKTSIVIPNWNGKDSLGDCLNALKSQSQPVDVIVVDNGSSDGSAEFIEKNYPDVILLKNARNLGFAGGVNTGIKYSLEHGYDFVALLNNDAVADQKWLEHLVKFLDSHPRVGIVTGKILAADGKHLDSTGDIYTIWGLPFPRGRDELDSGKYDKGPWIFGASGGASLYRAKMLKAVGLFDEDFFAYYEDIDISFRAQLAGWKIAYNPQAMVRHQIGATSVAIKGFAAYQTLKNLPFLMWKNVPWPLLPKVWLRLALAWTTIAASALRRGQFISFFKAVLVGSILWPKKLLERYKIQKNRKVSVVYIKSIITHDLPPNARKLRKLRSFWWKLRGKV